MRFDAKLELVNNEGENRAGPLVIVGGGASPVIGNKFRLPLPPAKSTKHERLQPPEKVPGPHREA